MSEPRKELMARVDTMGDSTDSRTAATSDPVRENGSSVPQPTGSSLYIGGTYRTHNHPSRFWETQLRYCEDGEFAGSVNGTTLDEAHVTAKQIVRAFNRHADLVAALKGIEQFALDQIVDLGANWQEGTTTNVHELRRWAAVISALQRAEGRS